MRCITATLAAGLVAATALFLPAQAHAQTSPLELLKIVNGGVATADCSAVGTVLRGTGMATKDTTRSELVDNLKKAIGEDTTLRLVTASTVTATADRAVECGVVKADPVTLRSKAVEMSSQLSSEAGLPDLSALLNLLGK